MFGAILRAFLKLFTPSSSGGNDQQHSQPPPQKPHTYPQAPHKPYTQPQPHKPAPHKPAYQKPPSPQQQRPPKRFDQNQVNQQNEYYTSLRARAREEGDNMAGCFDRSHDAYARGDGALAKQLSNEGKAHKARMEDLNRQASEWIFVENNKDSGSGEIDLHGLFVKEAIQFSEKAVQDARRRGDGELRLIVGRGLHSPGGVGKIKPAIETLLQNEHLSAEMDPDNAGVVVVRLDGNSRRAMGPDEIARRLTKDDGSCVIM